MSKNFDGSCFEESYASHSSVCRPHIYVIAGLILGRCRPTPPKKSQTLHFSDRFPVCYLRLGVAGMTFFNCDGATFIIDLRRLCFFAL